MCIRDRVATLQLIPAQKLAEILKVNVTTIERRAARGIYKYEYTEGRGRGGYQMLIALESLPENERDRYHGIETVSYTHSRCV